MTFDRLPREIEPPGGLEEATVATLRRQGLLHGRSWRWWQVAAAAAIFAAGAATGASWNPAREVATGGQRFVLLLHGGATASADEEARVAAAYREWAVGLRREGRVVAGERLGDAVAVVPAASAPVDEAVVGYFVVSAAHLDDASRVAQSAPHVARGGTIVVRPIDTP